MYRVDYDIAVGVSGHTAKDTALSEAERTTEPMPYASSGEFAVWCKTLLSPVDWKVASALAAARMTGRVWTWVHAADELRPGDHIALSTGVVYYYQHAIVSRVEGMLHIHRSYTWQRRKWVSGSWVTIFGWVTWVMGQ